MIFTVIKYKNYKKEEVALFDYNIFCVFLHYIFIYRYDCDWGGVVDGKPIVSGLEKFAMPIINSVWNSVRKQCPDEVRNFM